MAGLIRYPTKGMATMMWSAAAWGSTPGRSVALGIISTLVLLCPAGAGAQFSAQPVILEMRTGASMATSGFSVRNESDAEMQLQVYAADFDQPETGGHEFLEAGEHARSCVRRLRFFPDNLVLPAGGEGEVRVLMEPGEETCWSLVFIQSVSRQGSGIQIAQRIGVKVYGISERAKAEGEIRSVEVQSDSAGARWLDVLFENSGDGPLRPEGEVEIRTETGDIVAVVPVRAFSVLPGRTRFARIPLEVDLEPGVYLAIPILDFGGDYLAGGQAIFSIER